MKGFLCVVGESIDEQESKKLRCDSKVQLCKAIDYSLDYCRLDTPILCVKFPSHNSALSPLLPSMCTQLLIKSMFFDINLNSNLHPASLGPHRPLQISYRSFGSELCEDNSVLYLNLIACTSMYGN